MDEKTNNTPGIFNDVVGPSMRGPSSSHTAASWRIARTCLDILNELLKNNINTQTLKRINNQVIEI